MIKTLLKYFSITLTFVDAYVSMDWLYSAYIGREYTYEGMGQGVVKQ